MTYFKILAMLPLKVCVGILFLTACGPETRYELKAIQPSGSLEEYEDRTDVSSPRFLYELGWLYLQNGRTRAALGVFSRLAVEVPEEADAHFYLGVSQAKEHLKTEAVASFNRALELQPGLADAHWALALLFNERGDGFEEAIKAADRGLFFTPQNAYGHFVKGFILCSRGENDQAEVELAKSIELDGSGAHAHYYLALIYLRRQDDEKAIVAMERTIAADPSYTQAYYSLGTLYARTGREADGEEMVALFQRMSSTDMEEDHYRRLLYRKSQPVTGTKRAAGHFNLGLVLLKRNELEDAQIQFRKAVKADSTYAEALHNIGVVLSMQGMHAEALSYFSKSVSLDPSYALAYKNLGRSHLVQGNYEAAEASFRTALTLDESMVDALSGLATALIQQGKIEQGKAVRGRVTDLVDRGAVQ